MAEHSTPTFWDKLKHITPIVMLDSFFIIVSIWLAFGLRLNNFWSPILIENWRLFPVMLVLGIPLFYFNNVYRSNLRYAGLALVKKIALSNAILILLTLGLWAMGFSFTNYLVPRTCWFIMFVLMVGAHSSSRLFIRDHLNKRQLKNVKRKYVLIYGAGSAGIQLFRAMKGNHTIKIVGFLDNDPNLIGQDIDGLRIFDPAKLASLIVRHKVSSVLLAIPSLTHYKKRELLEFLSHYDIDVLIMPSLVELATGIRQVDDLRRVMIEDILGRDPVRPNKALLSKCITNKMVMVTGAGGSIGSELCRQILMQQPSGIVLFDNSEYSLYKIDAELRQQAATHQYDIPIYPVLGSVVHKKKIRNIVHHFNVQTIYHAAAYKHVPIVERNIIEGVQNNIFGTLSAALAAKECGVETFVLISTDKAVRPTNIMGATKRFAELILQSLSVTPTLQWHEREYSLNKTTFCMVRFGNVLASSGSVVPMFTKQIANGGPVTVTHPDIIRYFMTIPEAAQLVIQAGSLGKGGDLFLLDMGKPVKIYDLARRMIELSGLRVLDKDNPDGDIEIVFTGLRPGEKLYEELLISDNPEKTEHTMIFTANENFFKWEQLQDYLIALDQASRNYDHQKIRDILLETIEDFHPEGDIYDWLLQKENS